MQRLFSTEGVHPRDRFDYWHEVACRAIVSHDSHPESRSTFHAHIDTGAVADIGLIAFDTSSMSVERTASQVAQAGDDDIFVCSQVAGLLTLRQNGLEVSLKPGEFTLLDPALRYSGRFSQDSRVLVLKVPRHLLEARLGELTQMILRSVGNWQPEGSLLTSFLSIMAAHSSSMHFTAQDIVKTQVLDLLAVSLSKAMDGLSPRLSSAHCVAMMRIRAAIDARLNDPALDCSAVAAAAGLSVRYANALLKAEDTSIMRLIQSRRLERCRRALEDPIQARRTLSEIAYAWGFSDMTHFGRRFKAAYGVLPSEYRRATGHR